MPANTPAKNRLLMIGRPTKKINSVFIFKGQYCHIVLYGLGPVYHKFYDNLSRKGQCWNLCHSWTSNGTTICSLISTNYKSVIISGGRDDRIRVSGSLPSQSMRELGLWPFDGGAGLKRVALFLSGYSTRRQSEPNRAARHPSAANFASASNIARLLSSSNLFVVFRRLHAVSPVSDLCWWPVCAVSELR